MSMKAINYSLFRRLEQSKTTLFFKGLFLLLFSICFIGSINAQSLTDSIPTNPEDTVSSGGGGGAVILSGYTCDPLNNVPQWQENTNGDIFNCEDGNVGIGTNNPDIKLHVVGNITAQSTSSSQPDRRLSLISGSSQFLQARNNLVISTQFGGVTFNMPSATQYNFVHFNSRVTVSKYLNVTEGIHAGGGMTAIGNSGIGTTAPTAKLEVRGGDFKLKKNNQQFHEFVFSINTGTSGYNSHLLMDDEGVKLGHSSGFRDIQFQTANTTQMTIFQNGHVGIGTDATQNRLEVAGTIGACKVIVEQNNWCDYVFEDDYNLLPLSELEDYIAENKHLPKIPSAKSVDEQGLDLGEMQKMMMEKIEELTLYIIAQEKKIKELENKIGE